MVSKILESFSKLISAAQTTPSSPFNPLSLLPGLLILTPLTTIAQRTAQRGISILDPLVLAPGLHLQATANELNKGEYPACAALTTGYVFRVENPATVYYLQCVGHTGSLTDLKVYPQSSTPRPSAAYSAAVGCSILSVFRLFALGDVWGLFFVSNLAAIRLFNYFSLRRRSQPGWFGAPEPGVQGDLFILLSQDRWVRIRGAVDDLKALTSGTWLSEATTLETFLSALSKLLVYANVAIAGNAMDAGVATIASMLLVNSGLLELDTLRVGKLNMYGRTMEVVGEPKKYFRRRDLAEQLIKESGRDDWAVSMGMIVKDKTKDEAVRVTM